MQRKDTALIWKGRKQQTFIRKKINNKNIKNCNFYQRRIGKNFDVVCITD